MNAKSFDLGDVLSITTGCLLSPSGMGGIYKILNYMTGDELYTHQLIRAEAECRPELLRQHPALADVTTPALSGQTEVETWVATMAKLHGETLPVQPLPDGVHVYIDPMDELRAIKPEDALILPIGSEVQDASEDFGPCCACCEEGPTVRNLCMLPWRLPDTTDRRGGWGCLVCDLPCEGAVAVLCDRCVSEERAIMDVIAGYPTQKQRIPYASLTEPFAHDLARHSEIAA